MEIRGGNQFLNPQLLIKSVGFFEGQQVGYLGCGSGGYFTIAFAQAVGPIGKVYAVDILQSALDSTMAKVISKNIQNVVPVMANAEKSGGVAIPAGSLDKVFLINVLFQNSNKTAMIAEGVRLLKKNGKLMIVDWMPGESTIGPAAGMRLDPKDAIDLAQQSGLKLLTEGLAGDFHYLLVFKKIN